MTTPTDSRLLHVLLAPEGQLSGDGQLRGQAAVAQAQERAFCQKFPLGYGLVSLALIKGKAGRPRLRRTRDRIVALFRPTPEGVVATIRFRDQTYSAL